MRLQVSENRRFLQDETGAPFFLLGDTAWELFHRLTREEADFYLETRAAQGFNTVFAVALAEFDGLTVPNAFGDLPLHDFDPARPNEAYFAFVDYVVEKARSLNLKIGMLPTWGDKWNMAWPAPHSYGEIFTPQNAFAFGEYLGKRYAGAPIIWVLGGDRPVTSEAHRAIIDAMAAGVSRGDGGRNLRTFHPNGGQSSSSYFHHRDWLDFNLLQSGHVSREAPNHDMIARDYAMQPPKPCLDGEPRYENHPLMEPNWTWQNVLRFDADDVRRAAYHALFAGACGHVYGCHDVWQFFDAGRQPINHADTSWKKSLFFEGATQMRHLRVLALSRPYFSRVPDQKLILSENFDGRERIQATRDADGSYAFVYIPSVRNATINTKLLSGEKLRASWFDPRGGTFTNCEEFSKTAQRDFLPPSSDDWVLVLDDAAREYSLK